MSFKGLSDSLHKFFARFIAKKGNPRERLIRFPHALLPSPLCGAGTPEWTWQTRFCWGQSNAMALVAPGAGLAPLLAPWSSWEDVPTVLRGKLSYNPWDDVNSLEVSLLCRGKLDSRFSGTDLKRKKNASVDKHKTSACAFRRLLPGSKGHLQNVLKCFIGIRQPAAFSHTKRKKKSFYKRGLRSLTCCCESNSVRITYIHPQHETGFSPDGNITSRCYASTPLQLLFIAIAWINPCCQSRLRDALRKKGLHSITSVRSCFDTLYLPLSLQTHHDYSAWHAKNALELVHIG